MSLFRSQNKFCEDCFVIGTKRFCKSHKMYCENNKIPFVPSTLFFGDDNQINFVMVTNVLELFLHCGGAFNILTS